MFMKDKEAKESLIKYLQASEHERLWQAIRNWSGHNFIFMADGSAETLIDTFHIEGKGDDL